MAGSGRRVDRGPVVQDAARIGERLKSPVAVMAAHAGVPKPAEWEIVQDWMDRALVDPRIARPGALENLLGHVRRLREHVHRERGRTIVDPVDHLPDRVDFDNQQDRPERLLLHHRGLERRLDQRRRSDVQIIGVDLTAEQDRARVEQTHQPVEGPAVDHTPVVGTLSRIGLRTKDFVDSNAGRRREDSALPESNVARAADERSRHDN
jgi:hypothetical protein